MPPQTNSLPLKAPKNEIKPLKADPSEIKPLDPKIVELRRKYKTMPPQQFQNELLGMSEDDRNDLLDKLGIGGQQDVSISAAPTFNGLQPVKDGSIGIPIPGRLGMYELTPQSKQWLKEKGIGLLNWGQENLSNIAGPIGAHFGKIGGAAAGEAVMPDGGAAIGGYGGEVAGAGIGGMIGEASRQGLEHLEGVDKYNEPWENTWGERGREIWEAGRNQAIAQGSGMLAGRILRPTLTRSINNLYAANKLEFGDPKGPGQLESVFHDLLDKDNDLNGKTVTIGDLLDTVEQTKKDIGQRADAALSKPVRIVGGQPVLLKDVAPNPTPLVNLINDFQTKSPRISHLASLAGGDSEVVGAKNYQQMIKDRALTFQQKPWTYGLLAEERQNINRELNDYYSLTKDGKRLFLKEHPLLEVDKAIADYIRDITYPEMDKVAGYPLGTTAELQNKRGALIAIQDQIEKNLGELKTKSRQGTVTGPNVGAYATPSGIGAAMHRLPLKFDANNVEAQADRKVARAFGNSRESKARQWITTPKGNEQLGNDILSIPARAIIYGKYTRPTPKKPMGQEDAPSSQDKEGPQSSISKPLSPQELKERAKQMNPTAQGQVAYDYHAVHPQTGHRVVSRDGRVWIDPVTGQQVG